MIKLSKSEVIDKINKIYLLKSFLQKERIYFKFIARCQNPHWSENYFILCDDYFDIILKAFVWDSTQEGFSYWDSIDGKWIDYYEQYNEI